MEKALSSHHESKEKQWNPYENHGGTSIGIAGEDYVMLGSDTRLAAGYSIDCRKKSRIFKMSEKTVILATGFDADIDAFITRMRFVIASYEHSHFHEMGVESLAQCVANTLYSKRFFPYYIKVMVGGINVQGKGKLYGYDPVGTIEDVRYEAGGTGESLAIPVLDAVFGTMHRNTVDPPKIPIEEARNIVRDTFSSVTERDIMTGDFLEIAVLTNEGLKIEQYELPRH